jgi:DNA-directed RNA polymerase subunit RPC12/RpoP
MANESEEDQQAAAGGATLLETLGKLEAKGYEAQVIIEDGQLKCLACNMAFDPASVEADDLRRVEGASDPADMAAIAGITCPHCSTKGTVVLKYGPEAGPDDQDVLAALSPEGGV